MKKKDTLVVTDSNQQVAPIITLTDSGAKAPKAAAAVVTPEPAPVVGKDGKIKHPGRGFAIVSFIMGILALLGIITFGFFFYIPVWDMVPYGVGIVAGIMGTILGSIARRKGDTSGFAVAGLVMSIVSLAILGLLFAACVGCAGCLGALIASASA